VTARVAGFTNFRDLLASLPAKVEQNILRGAVLAGANVIAEEARTLCTSEEVRVSIKTSSRAEPGLVTAKVKTQGKGAYIAPWLEHGTDPHLIAVDNAQSGGMTVRRINRKGSADSLKIGGKFVGTTVHHPGATPHPFMRPAFDNRQAAAVEAMGNYVRARLTKEGLDAPPPRAADE
jgi:HK97 gp10 family phage protein